jgi:molecular chaperone DnaK
MFIGIGIDLGTSNSALARFDGEAAAVVPNALGENLTPSVVRVDAGGAVSVGRRAARFIDSDPDSVQREWKRLMGTAERLRLGAADRTPTTLAPEELSAHVVSSLLADARDALGFAPRAAVISTPALFELPQNHATVRAGKLAGLDEVVLIQEPIASAIAAGWRGEQQGLWLVFDLGGGTLDVSLLETKDGRLRVVDHSGDNFLGGKDMDRALVEHARSELARGGGRAWDAGRLKAACELAKIELSRADRTAILLPDGGELPITRATLEELAAPFIARSVAAVRALLARNRRSADDVARAVLVGGPTLMPLVRARIGELVGGRLAEGIDPMTIVARGAALYAGTAGLDARPVTPASAAARSGLAVRIEHPPVTADLAPFVVGRFLPAAGEPLPDRVRIEREGGGFATADTALSPEGSFVAQVELEPARMNRFRLAASDAAGAPVRLATAAFSIVHGISIADPPLSRSVGVASADDVAQVYFAKGTPLPARRTFVHHTVRAVAAGGGDDELLAIPVVQGESPRAHRNRLVGTLHLAGVKHDLPAGSRVEVTLQLDRSGALHARADIPAIGQTFEEVAHVLVPTATLETAERELEAIERRAGELQRRTFEAGAAAAVQALGELATLLAEAEASREAARTGDADAAQKLHRLLLDINLALDQAEAILQWPDLEKEARGCIVYYTPLVSQWGTAAEQEVFDGALRSVKEAEKRRDAADLERQLEVMRSIGKASYCRDPRSLASEIEWAAAHVAEALDVARAHDVVERARAAERAGNSAAVRALLAEIWDLFPSSPERQRRSFGSGVR